MEEKKNIQLPENAFTELKEGEQYEPVMSPMKQYAEVNGWSVTWGILMAVLFSAAAAYLGLKVGQVFEAAIPEHRRLLRLRGGRCHLHPARHLYPSGEIS